MIEVTFLKRKRLLLIGISLLLGTVWGLRQMLQGYAVFHDHANRPYVGYMIVMFLMFAVQLILAWMEKPFEGEVPDVTVCLNVPCYNEDPALLERCILSLFAQTRLPERIQVVDDGSKANYIDLREKLKALAPEGVQFEWVRTSNQGKRHAQMTTFADDDSDIFVTIDSDTVLHRRAIEEGLKPFNDPEVKSVAGVVLALNKHANLLTKVEDLVVTTWQLTMRSAYSRLSSVTVNCGPFALYRAEVVRAAKQGYLNETILGRPVQFSDDSLLTLYALTTGRTVQQASAIAFSAWPETLSHHVRQQLRWCRGSFIRSIWRFRYLSLARPAFWLVVLGWSQFVASLLITVLIVLHSHLTGFDLLRILVVMCLLSYATTVRTLTINRSDETLVEKLGVYALSPLVIVWAYLIYRPIRIFGAMTCIKTGWGTRQTVEVLKGVS